MDADVNTLNVAVEDERAIRAVRRVDVYAFAGWVIKVAEDPVSLEFE
jgi:hypothetical protein